MSNKDLEQQYHASRATSGLAPMSGGLNRRRSTAQVAPELTERRMTPVGGQPPPPSDRRSSQERPRSNFLSIFQTPFLIDVLVIAFFTTPKNELMQLSDSKRRYDHRHFIKFHTKVGIYSQTYAVRDWKLKCSLSDSQTLLLRPLVVREISSSGLPIPKQINYFCFAEYWNILSSPRIIKVWEPLC